MINGHTKRVLEFPTTDGLLDLSVAIYDVKEPKAIVHIIHGVLEHKGRYDNFCRFLQKNGYAVLISDNRGHGLSVNEKIPRGFMNGYEQIIQDQLMLMSYMKAEYSGAPVYLLGHSFGSMLARIFLQTHDTQVKKLAMTGTPYYMPLVNLGIRLASDILNSTQDEYHSSRLIKGLSRSSLPKKPEFYVNEQVRQKVLNDPLMVKYYSTSGHLTIFEASAQMNEVEAFQCKNPDLAIFSATGTKDILTGGKKGLRLSLATLQEAGYHFITEMIYPDMKHEVLFENHPHDIVHHDLLRFFDSAYEISEQR